MKTQTATFIKNFSIYSAIIMLISIIIQNWIPVLKISTAWPYIFLFMYGFTLFAFIMLVRYMSTKLTYFANAFMLVNFGKLVLFSVIIVVYALLNRDDAIPFTATFFIYYFLLTTFETVALLKLQKKS